MSIFHIQLDHSTYYPRAKQTDMDGRVSHRESGFCPHRDCVYRKFARHVRHKCKYLRKRRLFLQLLPESLSRLSLWKLQNDLCRRVSIATFTIHKPKAATFRKSDVYLRTAEYENHASD